MSERPRIPPVSDPPDSVQELLAGTLRRDGKPLHVFATLAHHPALLKQFNRLGGTLLNRGLVPAREREIVILRVGYRARAVYEFGQHTVIGRQAGLTDDEIAALARGDVDGVFPEHERDLVDFADELSATDDVSDDMWQRLTRRWSEAELVELLVLAGFYRLVSGFLNGARVQLDDGVPGWPAGAELRP